MEQEKGAGGLFGALAWVKAKFSPKPPPPRKSGAFHAWWQYEPGKFKPGIGMEIAVDSLVFVIEEEIATPEFNVVAQVRGRNIPIHVRVTVSDTVPHKGGTWHRYGVSFVGIAADHWDLIFRYVNDIEESENKREGESFGPDDAYRMLPLTVQHKIVALLVEQRKLMEPKPGQSPLLKLFFSGQKKTPDGGERHLFTIHSRILENDEMMAYDTRIIVDEKGDVVLQK